MGAKGKRKIGTLLAPWIAMSVSRSAGCFRMKHLNKY